MAAHDEHPVPIRPLVIERLEGSWTMVDEMQDMRARLDRLESLVGTCYHEDGSILPGLLEAVAQTDVDTMRGKVEAVIQFIRASNPHQ
jgi:hypothetical protein